MKGCFVTATGTEIGKTLICCSLLWQLHRAGLDARAIKPIVSGYDAESTHNDPQLLLRAQGIHPSREEVDKISPWRLQAAISPDLAAREENKRISFGDVLEFCLTEINKEKADYLFIEGAGGVMSPLTERHTNLDLISMLKLPVILVAGAYLGTVSHTLCSIETLRMRGVAIKQVVINAKNADEKALQQTRDMLERFLPGPEIALYNFPQLPQDVEELWRYAPDLMSGLQPL